MERKIGEVFEYEGKRLVAKETKIGACTDCFFKLIGCTSQAKENTGACSSMTRTDNKSVIFMEVKDEQSQELNLCEILKNCPEGWEFYSSIHGKVCFDHLYPGYDFSVCFMQSDGYIVCYSSDGKYTKNPNSECCLFPSKDQRDWSKFTAPWYKKEKFDPKTLKPFDKVIARCNDFKWVCEMFSHYDISKGIMPYVCVGGFYNVCIPYNEDTKHLLGTTDEAPDFYKYWEE